MKRFVIAIDGPAGSGKSTVAKKVAEELGFLYVDTGAMYRALTLKAIRKNIPLSDKKALTEMSKATKISLQMENSGYNVFLDGKNVTKEIREEEVSKKTQFIASVFTIRKILWSMQRDYRKNHDIVMEGRDIGSKVFPDAQLKIFLDAGVKERAKRRYLQLKEMGVEGNIKEIEKDILLRDERDRRRSISPLLKLPDAFTVDTTCMSIDQVTQKIISLYRNSSEERRDSLQ